MTKQFLTALLLSFLFACQSPDAPEAENNAGEDTTGSTGSVETQDVAPPEKLGIYTVDGDSLIVPSFEIAISLSPKAKDRIVNGNETIIVDIFLQGIPKEGVGATIEEDGSFYVGSATKEIYSGQVALFDNLKISRKIYDQLADKDPELTVNVYSGRKSSPDNLLTGDFLSDKLSNIVNRQFTLNQKLIYGDN